MIWLDFERPIVELREKLESLRLTASEGGNVKEDIKKLEDEINTSSQKIYSNLTSWQRVQLARHPNRPYTSDYIKLMFSEFFELHGDGCFRDDPAIIAGMGKIDNKPVVLIGHEKGRSTKERMYRNFGMANPEGYRKAMRVMKLGEKFKRPVISLIDTAGAYPGIGAEERGQAQAIAYNLREMSALKVPIIAIVTGEGGSGGALGIAVADVVLMQEYAFYSVISPEGCASILWRDANKSAEAAKALRITAKDLLELGVIDEIVPEPTGGAHCNPEETAKTLKRTILEKLEPLLSTPPEILVKNRVKKFKAMGIYAHSKV
ncbi:MAG: acetyl-CoA carboxylase carboxyltransferase subunit alpha [bacterium]|nr:acetyl-CoA carboxylase carboxyltransferase subunit alpha [bacterium]